MPNIQQQTSDDRFLVIALKQDDKQAFTRLFHIYYKDLVLFGGTYIPEKSISVRTVEVRISKALKQLRILLKDFYLLLFFFLFH